MFWVRFGAQLGTKLTIFRALDFCPGEGAASAADLSSSRRFSRAMFDGMKQKARQDLSGCLTEFCQGE
jgi:hypothetical protein